MPSYSPMGFASRVGTVYSIKVNDEVTNLTIPEYCWHDNMHENYVFINLLYNSTMGGIDMECGKHIEVPGGVDIQYYPFHQFSNATFYEEELYWNYTPTPFEIELVSKHSRENRNTTDITPHFAFNLTGGYKGANCTINVDDKPGEIYEFRPINFPEGGMIYPYDIQIGSHMWNIYCESGNDNITSETRKINIIENVSTCDSLDELKPTQNAIIGADIDCSGYTEFRPTSFSGNLTGNGFTISNLAIDCQSACGFILSVDTSDPYLTHGTYISDLVLENVTINSNGYKEIGIFAASTFYRGSSYKAQVSNVHVRNSAINGPAGKAGGLIGSVEGGIDIVNCSVENTIIHCNRSECGGLIGRVTEADNAPSTITDSRVLNPYLDCTAGSASCGGLIGHILYGNIKDSYSEGGIIYGNPDAQTSKIGGFVGKTGKWSGDYYDDVIIERSWTTTDIESGSSSGGFVGSGGMRYTTINECYADNDINQTNSSGDAGGFMSSGKDFIVNNSYTISRIFGNGKTCGFAVKLEDGKDGHIYNSYAAGIVEGEIQGCGFSCGLPDNDTNNYWNMETIEYDGNDTAGYNRTTAKMVTQYNYAGWSFGPVWTILEGYTYPYFVWQEENIPYAESPVTDSDGDGVNDDVDKCSEDVPGGNPWFAERRLLPRRYDSSNWDIEDSYGCSCAQVLYCKPGKNRLEYKFGCSKRTKMVWEAQRRWALRCQVDGKVV